MERTTRRVNRQNETRRRMEGGATADFTVVGHGEYATVTMARDGKSGVIQRFETEAEMLEQHRKNVAEDRPLVGYEGMN